MIDKIKNVLWIVGSIVFFPITLLLIIGYFAGLFMHGRYLTLCVWKSWVRKGKCVLFVYNTSPVSQKYVEKHILPKIQSKAIVVNWSESPDRKLKSLESMVMKHWIFADSIYHRGGRQRLLPAAVVFKPWWRPRELNFYEAFKAYKHGKISALKKVEEDLAKALAS